MNTTETMDADRAFEEVENMLYKLAWDTSKTYYIPYEECQAECFYAFVKAFNWRYNPNKGTKFATCVYNIAKWRMRNLVLARMDEVPTTPIEEEMLGAAPSQRSEALEMLEGLSEDANEILKLILETPSELFGMQPIPIKQLVNRIKDYLAEKGHKPERLERAHKEIKKRLQEAWA